jgi:hypothetical protein
MNSTALQLAAEVIVRRNITSNISRAAVFWDSGRSHLRLTYFCNTIPTEEDREWQELSMCELLAEFPEVVTAECHAMACPEAIDVGSNELSVYVRNAA